MNEQSSSKSQRPPGWWLASDGRWYPPELLADASSEAPEAVPLSATKGVPVVSLYPAAPPLAGTVGAVVAPRESGQQQNHPPLPAVEGPPQQWPASADGGVDDAFDSNRIVAIAIVAVAAVTIVGAFLPWVNVGGETVEGSVSGWQRHDGKATVAVAVALASIAGMLFIGWRSIAAKLVLIAGGVCLGVVAIVDAFSIIDEGNRVDTPGFDVDFSLGNGIWITVLAGVLFVALSIVERSPWRLDRHRTVG